ncbi:MAG TPA: redoxin family protein [Candidatus Baltobacteraceae bacterium]|nr:redoxin family protein [Candidatus Baltobacteraceae bacterium]
MNRSAKRAFASLAAVLFGTLLMGVTPSFSGGTTWLNSPPLTPESLRGKVVLVDFWEYTCINCLRTLPYLREWYRRYHDDGLVIVGVHTPEFQFSGDDKNVADAVKRLQVSWPVVLDDNAAIWNRYHNSIWPHEYLFDQNGNLVESQEGEGNYPQTEARIQALLHAANPHLHLPPVMALLPQDSYDKPGAVCYPMTPETYVGPWHGQHVADSPQLGDPTQYIDSGGNHEDGKIYLQGFWQISPLGQAMVSAGGDGYAALKYHAIQVVAVMRPEQGSPVRVNVTQDGKPLARSDAGKDITYDRSGMSYVTVDASRAYDLVMNSHFGSHELRLLPERYGLGLYSFDFESCEVPGSR